MCQHLNTTDAILHFNHGITKNNFSIDNVRMCFKLSITFAHKFALQQMCCIQCICILAPGANVVQI